MLSKKGHWLLEWRAGVEGLRSGAEVNTGAGWVKLPSPAHVSNFNFWPPLPFFFPLLVACFTLSFIFVIDCLSVTDLGLLIVFLGCHTSGFNW